MRCGPSIPFTNWHDQETAKAAISTSSMTGPGIAVRSISFVFMFDRSPLPGISEMISFLLYEIWMRDVARCVYLDCFGEWFVGSTGPRVEGLRGRWQDDVWKAAGRMGREGFTTARRVRASCGLRLRAAPFSAIATSIRHRIPTAGPFASSPRRRARSCEGVVVSRVCQVTGKKAMVGNSVSHANNKTKRRFEVNLQSKRYYLDEERGCACARAPRR